MTSEVSSYVAHVPVAADGAFDVRNVEGILGRQDHAEQRTIIFIGEGVSAQPLARFPELERRCHAEGVTILVRTQAEHDLACAEEQLPRLRQRLGSPGSDEVIDAAARAGPRDASSTSSPGARAAAGAACARPTMGPSSRRRSR